MAQERPPVFGKMAHGGHVVIHLLALGQQKPLEACSKDTMASGPLVDTDAYSMSARRERGGYGPKRVTHGRGEDASDEDGEGLCAGHGPPRAGFGSLLRSWLRPHRGISQAKLPLYLGCCECVHNVRRRGTALRGSLIALLVAQDPGIQ